MYKKGLLALSLLIFTGLSFSADLNCSIDKELSKDHFQKLIQLREQASKVCLKCVGKECEMKYIWMLNSKRIEYGITGKIHTWSCICYQLQRSVKYWQDQKCNPLTFHIPILTDTTGKRTTNLFCQVLWISGKCLQHNITDKSKIIMFINPPWWQVYFFSHENFPKKVFCWT